MRAQLGISGRFYGSVAPNAGAYAARTPFIAFVDDDDELAAGAGALIRRRLAEQPGVDIWIPPIEYSDGRVHCSRRCGMFDAAGGGRTAAAEAPEPGAFERCMARRGVVESNVCVPIYRTSLFAAQPFTHRVTVRPNEPTIFVGGQLLPHAVYLVDYHHVRQCAERGATVAWLGAEDEAVYLVRPRAEGHHGTESAKGLTLEDEEKAR